MDLDTNGAISLFYRVSNSISYLFFYVLNTTKKFLAWDFFPL